MKTLELTNARLTKYERGCNSFYGCPSYFLWFANDTEMIAGKTADDAPCGYTAMNFRDGRVCNVTYHITRTGNVIIDRIKEA